MSDMGDLLKDMLDRQAEAMKQYQDVMAESVKAWQSAFTPSSSSEAPSSEERPNLCPDAASLTDNYFNFAKEMLERQHEFAMRMIEALQPPRN